MVGRNRQLGWCKHCGRPVDLESGVEIVVRRRGKRVRTVLCDGCATAECPSCGTDVPVRGAIPGTHRSSQRIQRVECDRCGDSVAAANAVELRRSTEKRYRKHVCGDCLKEIAVPSEYRVVRDFAPNSH